MNNNTADTKWTTEDKSDIAIAAMILVFSALMIWWVVAVAQQLTY